MSEKNRLQEYCQKNKLQMPTYQTWSTGEPHKLLWSASVTIIIDGKHKTIDTIVSTNSKISAEKQAAALMFDHINQIKNKGNKETSRLGKLKDSTKINIISTHRPSKNPTPIDSSSDDDIIVDDIVIDEYTDIPDQLSKVIDDVDIHQDIGINKIYLIDLENKPCFKSILNFNKNSLYIGFINSIHHSVGSYNDWHKCSSDNIALELVESGNNKLFYLVDGGTSDLADHFMTAMIYPVVSYIQNTKILPKIYIISGDHAGWCTRACLEKILKWNKIVGISIKNATTI